MAEQAGAEEVRFPRGAPRCQSRSGHGPPAPGRDRALHEPRPCRWPTRKRSCASGSSRARPRSPGHQAEIRSAESQLALVLEEIATVKGLLRKGLERKPRLLALERSRAQIEGLHGHRPVGRGAGQAGHRRGAAADPGTQERARPKRSRTSSRPPAASLRRRSRSWQPPPTSLPASSSRPRSPGTVVDLKLKTLGGVVGAGDPLLDLVPLTTRWCWKRAWHRSTSTRSMPGFGPRSTSWPTRAATCRRIEGQVREVSADRLADTQTGEPYYKARIVVPATALPPGHEPCPWHAGRGPHRHRRTNLPRLSHPAVQGCLPARIEGELRTSFG